MRTLGACVLRGWAAQNGRGILRQKVRLVARAARGLWKQQREQPALLEPQQQRPHEREQQRGVPRRQALEGA